MLLLDLDLTSMTCRLGMAQLRPLAAVIVVRSYFDLPHAIGRCGSPTALLSND